MAASQRLRQIGQTAMAMQQHLSERGPGTAESAPLRPSAGIQAAIRVVKAGAQSLTHRSKTIPCDHMEPFSIFKSILLVLQVVQRRQKQSPEAETRHPGRHTGRVEDRQAWGSWLHPSGCGRPA